MSENSEAYCDLKHKQINEVRKPIQELDKKVSNRDEKFSKEM
jgi:hypothetical protein